MVGRVEKSVSGLQLIASWFLDVSCYPPSDTVFSVFIPTSQTILAGISPTRLKVLQEDTNTSPQYHWNKETLTPHEKARMLLKGSATL